VRASGRAHTTRAREPTSTRWRIHGRPVLGTLAVKVLTERSERIGSASPSPASRGAKGGGNRVRALGPISDCAARPTEDEGPEPRQNRSLKSTLFRRRSCEKVAPAEQFEAGDSARLSTVRPIRSREVGRSSAILSKTISTGRLLVSASSCCNSPPSSFSRLRCGLRSSSAAAFWL